MQELVLEATVVARSLSASAVNARLATLVAAIVEVDRDALAINNRELALRYVYMAVGNAMQGAHSNPPHGSQVLAICKRQTWRFTTGIICENELLEFLCVDHRLHIRGVVEHGLQLPEIQRVARQQEAIVGLGHPMDDGWERASGHWEAVEDLLGLHQRAKVRLRPAYRELVLLGAAGILWFQGMRAWTPAACVQQYQRRHLR